MALALRNNCLKAQGSFKSAQGPAGPVPLLMHTHQCTHRRFPMLVQAPHKATCTQATLTIRSTMTPTTNHETIPNSVASIATNTAERLTKTKVETQIFENSKFRLSVTLQPEG
jgi:hypothetical protein